MFSKIGSLICLALTACSVVQAVPSPTVNGIGTNANRMRRGLAPLAPVKRRPTRVAAAKRYTPSNAPGQTFNGEICAVSAVDGSSLGCLKRELDSSGLYTVTNGNGNHLPVQFTAASNVISSQINIKDQYNNRPAQPYMGGTGTDISAASSSSVQLTGVSQTPPGAPSQPGSTTGTGTKVESAIWKYNPSTGQISAQWVNGDGSLPATHIVYDPNYPGGGFVLTGNPTAYAVDAGHKDSVEALWFFNATP